MKEMIERLIADGWNWVACDKYKERVHIYVSRPVVDGVDQSVFLPTDDNKTCLKIPSCLFPEITFENSPIELKTLLVDDEEQDNIQREIKMLIVWKFEYLLKQGNGEVHAYTSGGTEWRSASRLKDFVPEVHEKVYLKDLVKKRKVKKSVWIAVDTDSLVSFSTEKPKRGKRGWTRDDNFLDVRYDSIVTKHIGLTWEDEPIELTYEVEES